MQSLAERVGRVDLSAGFVLREIRRQQWSFLNIPLMWAASAGDRSCAVLQWLADSESISVGGDSMSGRDAVMAAWECATRGDAGRGAFDPEKGCQNGSTHTHFSGRVQERLLNAAANHDARSVHWRQRTSK